MRQSIVPRRARRSYRLSWSVTLLLGAVAVGGPGCASPVGDESEGEEVSEVRQAIEEGSCGDAVCDSSSGEDCASCSSDCGYCCGNGSCEPAMGEDCSSCSSDCGSCCGDGSCEWYVGEDCGSCSIDCGSCPYCGDGSCQPSVEDCAACPMDCGSCSYCGDGSCDSYIGEDCGTCTYDCGSCSSCGDGSCDWYSGEDCGTCASDCGSCSSCGDGSCNEYAGEDCGTCASDCGSCSFCGNGSCDWDVGEHCGTCASDCGSCSFCGNGSCEQYFGEDCGTCAYDCGSCSSCGNGSCEPSFGEDCATCSYDCGGCAQFCGDGACQADLGEHHVTCPSDCDWTTNFCGDSLCSYDETGASCPDDCSSTVAVCGDGVCEPWKQESCYSCEVDCGVCMVDTGPAAWIVPLDDGLLGVDEVSGAGDPPPPPPPPPPPASEGCTESPPPEHIGPAPARYCGDGVCDHDTDEDDDDDDEERCDLCVLDCGMCSYAQCDDCEGQVGCEAKDYPSICNTGIMPYDKPWCDQYTKPPQAPPPLKAGKTFGHRYICGDFSKDFCECFESELDADAWMMTFFCNTPGEGRVGHAMNIIRRPECNATGPERTYCVVEPQRVGKNGPGSRGSVTCFTASQEPPILPEENHRLLCEMMGGWEDEIYTPDTKTTYASCTELYPDYLPRTRQFTPGCGP